MPNQFSYFSYKISNCRSSVRQRRNLNETADLTSIQELIDDVDRNCHSGNNLLKFLRVDFQKLYKE